MATSKSPARSIPCRPECLGHRVHATWDASLVRIFDRDTLVAVHARVRAGLYAPAPGQRSTEPTARQRAFLKSACWAAAPRSGPPLRQWAEAAVAARGVRAVRLIQGVLGLARQHPRERLVHAATVALAHQRFRYKELARLATGTDPAPSPRPLVSDDPAVHPMTGTPWSYSDESAARDPSPSSPALRHGRSAPGARRPSAGWSARPRRLPRTTSTTSSRAAPIASSRAASNKPVSYYLKDLKDFDWTFNPKVPKARLVDLATARFMRAVTTTCCSSARLGSARRTSPRPSRSAPVRRRLPRAQVQLDLVQDFAEADATGQRRALVQQLTRVDLLVLEDFGMKSSAPSAAEDSSKCSSAATKRRRQSSPRIARRRTGASSSAMSPPRPRFWMASSRAPSSCNSRGAATGSSNAGDGEEPRRRVRPSPWTLPPSRTAQRAARDGLENRSAVSHSAHRASSCRRQSQFTRPQITKPLACDHAARDTQRPTRRGHFQLFLNGRICPFGDTCETESLTRSRRMERGPPLRRRCTGAGSLAWGLLDALQGVCPAAVEREVRVARMPTVDMRATRSGHPALASSCSKAA